ncbi:hypothetical protein ABZ614_09280 [Streptomyces sp. NPDC013178]|uniref:hypothetical protein n=1 Tax=Streptomyces sp. NPDC013178 TaxID=3155118 RepID=UPI0033C78FA2
MIGTAVVAGAVFCGAPTAHAQPVPPGLIRPVVPRVPFLPGPETSPGFRPVVVVPNVPFISGPETSPGFRPVIVIPGMGGGGGTGGGGGGGGGGGPA